LLPVRDEAPVLHVRGLLLCIIYIAWISDLIVMMRCVKLIIIFQHILQERRRVQSVRATALA